MSDLQGRRIAFLTTNGYEPSELTSPWDTVTQQGGEAVLISPESDSVSSALLSCVTQSLYSVTSGLVIQTVVSTLCNGLTDSLL